jgi:hypothetical protein
MIKYTADPTWGAGEIFAWSLRKLPQDRFTARLNSFRIGVEHYWQRKNSEVTTFDLIKRAATCLG